MSIESQDHIDALPLESMKIDLVIDCTGAYGTPETLEPYFRAGVERALVACPVKDPVAANLVYGVNHHTYDPARHKIVTAASCTTNCLAPVFKVVHENIGIRHGSIKTLHDVTKTQTLVYRPVSDLRRARSALNSLIPTTTGSATAITLIYAELAGKLNGYAVLVPLLNASLTDCVFELERSGDRDELNSLFKESAAGALAGIFGFEPRPSVSADYVNDSRSAIIDGLSTMVINGTQAKIYTVYDNEWGYTGRLDGRLKRGVRPALQRYCAAACCAVFTDYAGYRLAGSVLSIICDAGAGIVCCSQGLDQDRREERCQTAGHW